MDNKRSEDFLEAVANGDGTAAAALIKAGVDVNARDPETGLTALMTAAGRGNAAMVRQLLTDGADVHMIDPRAGASALHKACQSGNLETVRLLVEAGSFLNLQSATTGHTPLIDAIWYTYPDIVEYLLAMETGLNLHTSYGFTLLDHVNYALKTTSVGKERFLKIQQSIERRQAADREKLASQKLLAAVLAKDLAWVRQAIKDGADLECRAPMANSFDDGYTPLLIAAREGLVDIVKELLAAGANPNATDAVFVAVPLHKATYHGYRDITEVLVKHPGVDLDFQGATNGYTPLHDALWHGYDDCAQVLIDAGASLQIRAHDGTNALDIAVKSLGEEHELVQLLRKKMGL